MRELHLGGEHETAVERSDYPPERLKSILDPETVAVVGYGVQGRGQSLNMRDNGVKVVVGQRRGGKAYDLCLEDGWVPGETLFTPEEAAERGTVVQYLLSDAGQKEMWPRIKPHLTAGKALYFSHGFAVVYADQTRVVPPADIDVILVAPKGSGTTVRRLFLEGRGINSSLCRASGRHRQGARPRPGARHRHRLGIPVRDDVPERGVLRPHRRARRADGRDLRHLAGPVRGATRPRATRPARRSTRPSRRRPSRCTP